MKRREFMQISAGGLAALALTSAPIIPRMFHGPIVESDFFVKIQDNSNTLLSMEEVLVETFSNEPVYMRIFQEPEIGPRVPGPVIFALEGQPIELTVVNNLIENHGFRISGVIDSGTIEPGRSVHLRFQAPEPGTYLYFDPINDPVNRVLGLHGMIVVMPASGNTPYGDTSSPMIQELFNDLGSSAGFPGDPWLPERTFIWVLNEIDPSWNLRAQNGEEINPGEFTKGFLPRFFTINGKSGFFSSQDEAIAPHGSMGQPSLLRVANAGLATHSLHHHGNHVYLLNINNRVQNNVLLLDTYPIGALETKDVLLPFMRPFDIPPETWPPRNEGFPLRYPIEDAFKIGQTADGGNFPQGLSTVMSLGRPAGASALSGIRSAELQAEDGTMEA